MRARQSVDTRLPLARARVSHRRRYYRAEGIRIFYYYKFVISPRRRDVPRVSFLNSIYTRIRELNMLGNESKIGQILCLRNFFRRGRKPHATRNGSTRLLGKRIIIRRVSRISRPFKTTTFESRRHFRSTRPSVSIRYLSRSRELRCRSPRNAAAE